MDPMPLGIRERTAAARYGIAALAVAAAVAVRFALDPFLGSKTPFILFTLAVMVASRFGGKGPGLAATAGGVLAGWYVFVPPRYSFVIADRAEALNLILFAAMTKE